MSDEVLKEFGRDLASARRQYRAYVQGLDLETVGISRRRLGGRRELLPVVCHRRRMVQGVEEDGDCRRFSWEEEAYRPNWEGEEDTPESQVESTLQPSTGIE